jgi:hypothetical protein
MITNFVAVDPQKLVCGLPDYQNVTQFAITLLDPAVVPAGFGVGVYYGFDQDWSYLGFITPENPTRFFKLPQSDDTTRHVSAVPQIGLLLESVANLSTLVCADQVAEAKTVDSVRGIATDLYKFISSFAQDHRSVNPSGDYLVVPGNVINRWLEKFNDKHRKTPFFWMEQKD